MTKIIHTPALATLVRPGNLAVLLEQAPPRGMIAVRANLDSASVSTALGKITGLAVPAMRQFVCNNQFSVYWMSPDELLVETSLDNVGPCLAAMGGVLAGTHHLLADMSDARVVLRLAGDGCREVLAKGLAVDFDPAAFRPGMLRRSHIAKVAVMVTQVAAVPDIFDIYCFRSYGRHVYNTLRRYARAGSLPATRLLVSAPPQPSGK